MLIESLQRLTLPILLSLAVIAVASFWFIPPIPQPQWYHSFADQRMLLGIPNFWNVISNLPFLFVGGWGACYVLSAQSAEGFRDSTERWMYLVFFAAVALTGIGSAYYHWYPKNETLVWDRLPITITFMALFAIIIAERIDLGVGAWLFWPLVIVGAATVFYWYFTETWGRGDLRPYLLTQIYPLLAIPVVLWLYPPVYTNAGNLYAALGWYVGAKIYEFLDMPVYLIGRIISGHTLKHVGAAVSCYLILNWVRQRRVIISSTLQGQISGRDFFRPDKH
jgi:hypothetical protein